MSDRAPDAGAGAPDRSSIVLTGASSGIGAALALALSVPGTSLLLLGRDAARLDAVAKQCSARGASVTTATVDVADTARLAALLERHDDAQPVSLVIANAGVSLGLDRDRTPEDPDAARALIETNVLGTMNTLAPLLPRLIARGRGQIAVMGSLAGSAPLADMPAYSASKAAIRAYGISLRRWLSPRGIAVSVICPGFVTSPMSQRHRGFKPFEISPERAAARILRGLARREAVIAFPWPLVLLTWLGNRLPPGLSDVAMRGFAAEIERDERDG